LILYDLKKFPYHFGGGSVINFGTLDRIKQLYQNTKVGELGGIEANPYF